MQAYNKFDFIFICPGARNQRVFEYIKDHALNYSIEFDERSAAFKALGMAKQMNKSVAIITTSGTAVGETLPAVMEAYHDHIKLCVISYDRPTRLKEVYSPQATHQEMCLSPYIRSTSLEDNLYPKHINILEDLEHRKIEIPKETSKPLYIINKTDSFTLSQYNELKKKDIYIHQELESPFYKYRTDKEIKSEALLDKLLLTGKYKYIVRIGKTPNCNMWRKLEKTIKKIPVKHFIESHDNNALSYGEIITKNELELLIKEENSNMQQSKETIVINSLIKKYKESEQANITKIIEQNDSDKNIFYIGNSMAIRVAKLALIKKSKIEVSRGLNGIDGQVSTAIGIAMATTKQVTCIVGDQTFLYDLNTISKKLPENLKVYVINNFGGRIFDYYNFDNNMINEHNISIKSFTNQSNIIEILTSKQQTKDFLQEFKNEL